MKTIKEVVQVLGALKEEIKISKEEIASIKEKVELLTRSVSPQEPLTIPTNLTESSGTPIPNMPILSPFPPEYREYIDTRLNKHFSAEVRPFSGTQIELRIIVPDRYSTAKPELRKDLGGDLRLKILDSVLGLAGVKDYVDQVWNTFSLDYQASITADRLVDSIEPVSVVPGMIT